MLKAEDLEKFGGTEHWFRHQLIRNVLYTDGAKYVADEGGAYWLIDAIASYQLKRKEPFQVWNLVVNPDKSAVLTMKEDSDQPILVKQDIRYTDFPLPKIEIWAVNNGDGNVVILLPSEY